MPALPSLAVGGIPRLRPQTFVLRGDTSGGAALVAPASPTDSLLVSASGIVPPGTYEIEGTCYVGGGGGNGTVYLRAQSNGGPWTTVGPSDFAIYDSSGPRQYRACYIKDTYVHTGGLLTIEYRFGNESGSTLTFGVTTDSRFSRRVYAKRIGE